VEPVGVGEVHAAFLRDDKKKARRVLWYPTQAKTGLEWGTQPSLTVKKSKKVTTS
jgi:hypothetical protein